MNKKDVLFVCQFFYPEYISSATLPFDMAEKFVKSGHSVDVLCGYPKEYAQKSKIPRRETVACIEINRIKYIQVTRKGFVGRLVNFASFSIAVLLRLLKFRKYKVVYVFSNPPILPVVVSVMQAIFGFKLVFVCYDVYPEIGLKTKTLAENGLITRVMKSANKYAFKRFHQVVSICMDMTEFLKENRSIKNHNISTIPNWDQLKSTVFSKKPSQTNRFKQIGDDDFIIAYLGNMGTCQDLETIINCIKITPSQKKVTYIFAGHGNKFDQIKKMVKSGELKNTFCYDFLQGEDLEDVMSISDCYVVSLVEGLWGLCAPSKVPGYLMKRKPILCIMDADTEIARDIENYNAGWMIENNDAKGCLERILTLQADMNLTKKMGENAGKLFDEKYEKNICLTLHQQNLQKILNEGHAPD